MRFRPIRPLAALLGLLLAPLSATAEPLSGDAAREQLFLGQGVEVLRYTTEGLSADEVTLLTTLAQSQRYYAAFAYAPDAGIMAEPTVMAANYHDSASARAAALAQCDQRRSGGAACTLLMEVRPQGWEERALTLSADATEGFQRDFLSVNGPRALAISRQTAGWGIGEGENAADRAQARCAQTPDARDCTVVIAD